MTKRNKILLSGLVLILIGIGVYLLLTHRSTSSVEATADTTIDLSTISGICNITKGGTYTFTGSLNGYLKVNTTSEVTIILDNVTITNDSGPVIYIESSLATYIELKGDNTLVSGATYQGFDDVDSAIYSKDNLTIMGDGVLNLTANYQDGITSKDTLTIKSGTYNITSADDGLRGTDDLAIIDGLFNLNTTGDGIKSTKGAVTITTGTFNIVAANDGVQAETSLTIAGGTFDIKTGEVASAKSNNYYDTSTESLKGLKAGTDIIINDITYTANTADDAIHANGNIQIEAGTITISTADDAIHADSQITIDGGTINILTCYEGIEAHYITINDGTINLVATDDGINVNGGDGDSFRPDSSSDTTDLYLIVNGGTIYINAKGDGLDSNGSIIMNGGTIYVDGPTDNGNGALDYNNTFTLNSGTLIAAGASGMALNTTSGQNSVLIYFNQTLAANSEIKVGNITYSPTKTFNSIVISSADLVLNQTYTIYVNNEAYQTFTLSKNIMSVGNGTSNNMMPKR